MAEQIVQNIVDWVSILSPFGIYAIFFGVAYIENVIPPIPGDVLVAFGGYLAAAGIIGAVPLIALTTIASVLGFMNMYWFGGKWGDLIERKEKTHWLHRFFDFKYFEKGKKWMNRWGQGVIIANRFLAGTRSIISLTAGFYKLNPKQTVLSSLVSSIVWNSILVYLGWLVQENWKVIGEYLSAYSQIILGVVLVLIIARIVWYFLKQKRASEEGAKKENK